MANQLSEHWDSVYLAKSSDSVSWYQETPQLSIELIRRSVRAPASVLDVGAGASNLVDHLLDLAYSPAVLEISTAALEVTKARLGTRAKGVAWFVCDVRQFRPDSSWAVWHDRAVFHFLTEPRDRAAYRVSLEAATSRGSHVIIATFAPDGPERCSGLPVRRYSPEGLQRELGALFRLVDVEWESHRTPSGNAQSFVYCRFQRVH